MAYQQPPQGSTKKPPEPAGSQWLSVKMKQRKDIYQAYALLSPLSTPDQGKAKGQRRTAKGPLALSSQMPRHRLPRIVDRSFLCCKLVIKNLYQFFSKVDLKSMYIGYDDSFDI